MTRRLYIVLLVALVGAYIAVELSRPTPLDMRVRLEREGSAPFDAEVFYQALPEWLGAPVEPVAEPPFERLADSTFVGRTYVFLTQSFAPDEAEAQRLLRFVERGNTLFVAANWFDGPLGDVLGDTAQMSYDNRVGLQTVSPDGRWNIVHGSFDADTLGLLSSGVSGEYRFPIRLNVNGFRGLDSARTEVLGEHPATGLVTLARVRHGAGEVILSSTPLAFSNAALVGEGDAAAYVGGVLAALPRQPVFWDDHYKPYADFARTPLRYVLQTPALRWAYGLLALGAVLFLLFRGRRWQRAVPVVAPPPNAQREFARTVGRLHFLHGDTCRLAARKTRVFLDRLRTVLRIDAPDLSPETAHQAAARAGVPADEARALFAALDRAGRERYVDPDLLVRLDGQIDRFFRHTPGTPGPS